LKFYCSNYIPVNAPEGGEASPNSPIVNDEIEILDDTDKINTYNRYERIRPMIKLPGMNGYIKILSRNIYFKTRRTPDGKYEMFYNVEFPYCPGSYFSRVEMDFVNGPKLKGFIYKMRSYINAGSWEVYGTTYDKGNDRYVPYSDDSFVQHSVLLQYAESGTVTTDPNKTGGKLHDVYQSRLKSIPENRVTYPADVVWKEEPDYSLLSLTKSRLQEFSKYGTYDIRLNEDRRPVGGPYLDYFSRDMKLFALVDNRQWRFSDNKFISYINRENPCYVFQIDISALLNDYSKYQKDNGAVPDNKRWLYNYVSAFASTIQAKNLSLETEVSDQISTMNNFQDLAIEESKSDIAIEIWDSKSVIGSDGDPITGGNWRPLSSVDQDILKIPGNVIVDDVYISGHSSGADDPVEIMAPAGYDKIYSIYVGCNPSSGNYKFPEHVNYSALNSSLLHGGTNLVLYDKTNNKAMHIVYIQFPGGGDPLGLNREIYKVYVMNEDANFIFFNPDSPELDRSDVVYQIRSSDRFMNKNTKAATFIRKAIDETEEGSLRRFIDFRGNGTPYSDFDRYVVDGKINFRIRVKKGSNYPVSFSSEDESQISYIGAAILSASSSDVGINFPWSNSNETVFQDGFDWGRFTGHSITGVNARPTELVRKFGLNYFNCASK
jgi:hypothetical protein